MLFHNMDLLTQTNGKRLVFKVVVTCVYLLQKNGK